MHAHGKPGEQPAERFSTGRANVLFRAGHSSYGLIPLFKSTAERAKRAEEKTVSYAGDFRKRAQRARLCVRAAASALFAAPGAATLGRSTRGGGASPGTRAPTALPSDDACSRSALI